ncbi:MAG: hypothetical protein WBO34_01905 [Gammaproteobacteria bacterium]
MYRLHCILLLTGLVLTRAATAQDAQFPAYSTPTYRLNELAMAIADEHVMLRVDLARIALSELAAIYDEEAEQARRDMRLKAEKPGLWRWSTAVKDLAADYATLAGSITLTTPIEVRVGPDNSLHLVINGRLVAVSSPRMNEQLAFEQHVIEQFCNLNRCADLLDDPAIALVPMTSQRSVDTRWSFSQGMGPVCETTDGLQFQFRNMDNLDRKRDACSRAVRELNDLASAIARNMAAGVRVDWGRLAIHPLADGNEQVTLNREGDYLRLPLPALAERKELFIIVRPWLAAKSQGTPYQLVVLHAGELLGPPGFPLE